MTKFKKQNKKKQQLIINNIKKCQEEDIKSEAGALESSI